VIGVPPLKGAVQSNVADESEIWTERPVGTDGLVIGTTEPDIVAAEVPIAFLALTLTLYSIPYAYVEKIVDRDVTTLVSRMLEDGSNKLTLYDVIGDPWGLDAGHDATITDWNAAVTEVGGSGVVSGLNSLE
jgi:hypothetical protein